MTDQTSTDSPRSQARIASFLYLIIIVAGAVGYSMHSTLVVWSDAAAMATNILASELLWRLSFAAMLVMLACDVGVAAIFYVLFKPVNRTLSLIACAFRLVLVAIVGVASLGRYAPLLLLKDTALAALETDQLQAMGLLSIPMFERGFDVALVFFGFHFLAIGWLIYRSRFLPRFMGVLLIIAGSCYLISTSVSLVVPAEAIGDGQRIAVHPIAGLELPLEVGRPGPVGSRDRDQRMPPGSPRNDLQRRALRFLIFWRV